jgi:hypothetical protein
VRARPDTPTSRGSDRRFDEGLALAQRYSISSPLSRVDEPDATSLSRDRFFRSAIRRRRPSQQIQQLAERRIVTIGLLRYGETKLPPVQCEPTRNGREPRAWSSDTWSPDWLTRPQLQGHDPGLWQCEVLHSEPVWPRRIACFARTFPEGPHDLGRDLLPACLCAAACPHEVGVHAPPPISTPTRPLWVSGAR